METEAAPRWRRNETRLAIIMLVPAVLLVAGVYLYPLLLTLTYSFARVDISTFSIDRFVGLQNYVNALRNEAFLASLVRTLYLAVMVVSLTLGVAFAIALLLNQPFFGRTLVRVVVTLPWAVPGVLSGVLWGQMFHADAGFINAILYKLGLPSNIVWLGDPTLALNVIIVAQVWQNVSLATLFLLAGLQNIPESVMEAAAIDGAGAWARFRHILLPLMTPVIIPVVALQFTSAMRVFDSIFVLTQGGPGRSTTTLNYWVYQEGFVHFNLGQASASAYILLTITVLSGMFFLRLQRRLLHGWGR